jgi:hypothetical protein
MGEIEDAGDAEDQGETNGQHRIDGAGDRAVDQNLKHENPLLKTGRQRANFFGLASPVFRPASDRRPRGYAAVR